MRGATIKRLRAKVLESGIRLSRKGWRRLKSAWESTPAAERESFDVVATCKAFAAADVKRLFARLSARKRTFVASLVEEARDLNMSQEAFTARLRGILEME